MNKYSQNGEDGILQDVFQKLNITNGKCCEFGSHDGYFCSNTRLLVEQGWQGVFMDAIHGDFITPENVNVPFSGCIEVYQLSHQPPSPNQHRCVQPVVLTAIVGLPKREPSLCTHLYNSTIGKTLS